MRQQRDIVKKEKETSDKIAARAFAQSYLADLVPTVFGTLSDNGYFYDPVERGKLGKWHLRQRRVIASFSAVKIHQMHQSHILWEVILKWLYFCRLNIT